MKGICNCGSVVFSISGKLPNLYQCHCSLCRRQSGTGSNTATIVRTANFHWISGENTVSRWQKETGFPSHFCRTCGSPVPNPLKDPYYMWIPVGLLEDFSSEIVAHLWCGSSVSWQRLDDSSRHYDGMPDDLEEFIEFLNA